MRLECVKKKVVRKRKGEEENQRKNDYFIYKINTQNKQNLLLNIKSPSLLFPRDNIIYL